MDIHQYIENIRTFKLFQTFEVEELFNLFQHNGNTISSYKKNCIIHSESEKCETWDLILAGNVMIQQIDYNGHVLTVTEFTAGDNIGENLLFSEQPYYPMNVIAKSDTLILHLKRSIIIHLCQINQDFLLQFLTCISNKATILTSKIKSIATKSIRESIIEFLRHEYAIQKRKTIQLRTTKKELAEALGFQRTSLSRELNKMRKEGLIQFDAKTITICNKSILSY